MRHSFFKQMRDNVEQVITRVEKRSGGASGYETRPEGCFGGVSGCTLNSSMAHCYHWLQPLR
jgi:hypothetical protein